MNIQHTSFRILAYVLVLLVGTSAVGQQTSTCLLTPGVANSEVSASLAVTSIKTGLDFSLGISLPGLQGCDDFTVQIKPTSNIAQGSGSNYPAFIPVGGGVYENSQPIPSTAGLNISVPFRFKPGTTCNNAVGKFTIVITTKCGGVTKSCELNVSLTAIATNTWTVKKEHVWGNLSGGNILWRVTISNSDNSGFGTYNIASGAITDLFYNGTILSVSGATPVYSGSSATWNTGPISNTTSQVQYDVLTTSCDPSGTVVKNCIKYKLKLGKLSAVCENLENESCANVTLTDKPVVSSNFSKQLTYSNSAVNYAQGCEGEYTIAISNNGNIPLTAFQLTDPIPSGITVTAISISSTGANMNYTTTSPASSGNTSTTQNITGLSLTNPSTFAFNTTSGVLLGDVIYIKMRFTITATTGTLVTNCANLNYSGTYLGMSNVCNINFPPVPTPTSLQRCAPFTVEAPKSIPGLKKCIPSGVQSYNIGDDITFRIVVTNHGSGNLSSYTLSDLLSAPQFLEINSAISYGFGVGAFSPGNTGCSNMTVGSTIPTWLTANNIAIGSQNPSWTINGMPGNCQLDKAYYLVIEFKAKIRPCNWGNYTNTAKLSGATNLSSSAPYNILRLGKLDIDKLVNSGAGTSFGSVGYVNPGQAFQFQLVISNLGSVQLNNIDINDALPSCVQVSGNPTGVVHRNNGTTSSVTVSAPPALNFTPAVSLAPGEWIAVTINVTRNASDNTAQCCNDNATVNGVAADNGMDVFSVSQQACVKKSLCCDLNTANLTLTSQQNNVQQWTQLNFNLTAGNLPIQEVTISLIDYTYSYTPANCRPANVGNLTGHIAATTGLLGGVLALTPPNTFVNNSLTWKLGSPANLNNGVPVGLRLYRPYVMNLPCCSGTINYCFKVTIKDVDCRVCEKIYCFSSPLPKPLTPMIEGMQDKYDKGMLEEEETSNDKNP